MGFDTIVTDDPRFPSDLLPFDRRYRPDLGDPSKGGRIVLGVIAIFVSTIAFHVFFPIPTTFENATFYSVLGLLIVLFIVRTRLKASKVVPEIVDAIAMGGRGELVQAEKLLDIACLRSRSSTAVHCYAVHERAIVALLRGDLQNAIGMSGAICTSRGLLLPGTTWHLYWGMSLGLLARCLALQGKMADAEKWQAFARASIVDAWSTGLLPGDMIIGLRTGRVATVLADAERDWTAAEAILRGWELRAMRLYCAFGAAQLAGEAGRSAAAERWLAGLHPRRPGEFTYLAKQWPELQAFIDSHGL